MGPDYPFGLTPEQLAEEDVAAIAEDWGSEKLALEWMSSLYARTDHDPIDVADFAAFMRSMGGPGDVARFLKIDAETDVRELLPSMRVPTLVVHRLEDRDQPIEHGRYLAEHIPGAEFVEMPGGAHAWDADDALTTEVGQFLASIHAMRSTSIGSSARCCSPTSSARPTSRRRSAIEPGPSW